MADHRTRADKLRDMAAKGTPPERAIARSKLEAMGESLTAPVHEHTMFRYRTRTAASNVTNSNGAPLTDDDIRQAYESVVRGFRHTGPFAYTPAGERDYGAEEDLIRARRARSDATRRFTEEMARARERARNDARAQQAAYRAERDAQRADREHLERLLRQAGVRPGGGTQTFEMDPDTGDFAPVDGPRTRQPFEMDDDDFEFIFSGSRKPRFQVEYSAQSGQPVEVKRRW